MRPRFFPAAIAALLILAVALARPAAAAPDLASLRLPPGFEIGVRVPGDDSMLRSDDVSGVVYRITHRSAP
jgi:hypothetical protein